MNLITFPDGAQIVIGDGTMIYQFRLVNDVVSLVKPDGETYVVRPDRRGHKSVRVCNCKGFQFRGACKHSKWVRSLLQEIEV